MDRYDEALNKARAGKRLEEIFPELKESEDERIRRHLIDIIETYWGTTNDPGKAADLAWLEKQKEQKVDINKLRKDIYQSGYNDGYQHGKEDAQKERKPVKEIDWTRLTWEDINELERIINNVHYEFPHGIGEESFGKEVLERFRSTKGEDYLDEKEQKPILEVFGFKVGDAVILKDGDGRKHIIKSFEEVEGLHGPNFYHVEFEDNSARDGIYPGEEYPNGYYTQMEKFEEKQKPAEWSETADRLVSIAECLEMDGDCLFNGCSGTECGKFLRELARKQVECKPAEWSEKDERHRSNCLSYFNGIVKSSPYYEDYLWLKSLRPSWKPSEEQIGALNYAYCELFKRGDVDHNILGQLQNLIDTLSKL